MDQKFPKEDNEHVVFQAVRLYFSFYYNILKSSRKEKKILSLATLHFLVYVEFSVDVKFSHVSKQKVLISRHVILMRHSVQYSV